MWKAAYRVRLICLWPKFVNQAIANVAVVRDHGVRRIV
jgi:hypothetical protein